MDEEVRRLQRSCAPDERARLIRAWLRSGKIEPWRVELAALVGCPHSAEVLGTSPDGFCAKFYALLYHGMETMPRPEAAVGPVFARVSGFILTIGMYVAEHNRRTIVARADGLFQYADLRTLTLQTLADWAAGRLPDQARAVLINILDYAGVFGLPLLAFSMYCRAVIDITEREMPETGVLVSFVQAAGRVSNGDDGLLAATLRWVQNGWW